MSLIENLRQVIIATDDWVNPWLPVSLAFITFLIALVGTHPIRVTDEKGLTELAPIYIRKVVFVLSTVILLSAPIALYFFVLLVYGDSEIFYAIASKSLDLLISKWWLFVGAYLITAAWRWLFNRYVPTWFSAFKRRFAIRVSSDTLSDIRAEISKIESKDYEVKKHYKDGYMFLGLGSDNKPILIKDEDFKTNNINCIGPSQTGKGVLQQIIIDQAIRKNWNVFFIDQKPDDFIPDLMRETCEEVDRKLITLDLTGESKGTYCPFNGGTTRERISRFFSASDLADKGNNADFYKGQERAAMSDIMPHWNGSIRQLSEFLNSPKSYIAEQLGEFKANRAREALTKVSSLLIEWNLLAPINAKAGRGFDVERTIKNNGVALIRGSVSDKLVIKFTKVIIDEIVSTVLRLGKKNKPEHTILVIDEARFIISDELAKALATMLAKGCSTMISYQSINDTKNLDDKTLNADSISQSINVNSNYTLCYRAKDAETAEWLSDQTGTIQKSVARMENVERNRHGGEVWSKNKSLNAVEENYFHTNLLFSLPERVCVFLRPNELAQLCYTHWLPIQEQLGLSSKDDKPTTDGENKQSAATKGKANGANGQAQKPKKVANKPKAKIEPTIGQETIINEPEKPKNVPNKVNNQAKKPQNNDNKQQDSEVKNNAELSESQEATSKVKNSAEQPASLDDLL